MSRRRVGWFAGVAIGVVGGALIGLLTSDRGVTKRLSASAHGVREKGEELRDRGVTHFGRAVFQAAEARDATLNAVDLDDDTGPIPEQDGPAEAESKRAL